MICSFPLFVAVCCLMQTAAASEPTRMSAQKSDSLQNSAPPTATPPLAPVQQQGKIPPRDPRLPPPPVQETTVPPNVFVPAPPAGNIATDALLHPITADEAARIALLLQPNVLIAKAGITVQGGVTRQIKAALLPHVTVLTGYTHVQNLTRPGDGGIAVGSGGTGTGSTGSTGTSGTGTTAPGVPVLEARVLEAQAVEDRP